jgi:hypothetical protein
MELATSRIAACINLSAESSHSVIGLGFSANPRAADLGASRRAAEGQARRAETVYLRRGCVSTAAVTDGKLSIQDAGFTRGMA